MRGSANKAAPSGRVPNPASICQGPFKARGATTRVREYQRPQTAIEADLALEACARRRADRGPRVRPRVMVANRCASRASAENSRSAAVCAGSASRGQAASAAGARRRKRAADARKRCCYAYDLGPRVLSLSSRCFRLAVSALHAQIILPAAQPSLQMPSARPRAHRAAARAPTSRAASSKSTSASRSAKRSIGTPLWRAPSNSPGPRSRRSCRAISKPSLLS